jgi:hypothetical protein
VLSLAVDEPAYDFTNENRYDLVAKLVKPLG